MVKVVAVFFVVSHLSEWTQYYIELGHNACHDCIRHYIKPRLRIAHSDMQTSQSGVDTAETIIIS